MGVDLGRDARVINTREQVARRVRSIIEAECDAMRANEVRAHVAVGDQAQPEDRVSQEARLELHLSKIAARAVDRLSGPDARCETRQTTSRYLRRARVGRRQVQRLPNAGSVGRDAESRFAQLTRGCHSRLGGRTTEGKIAVGWRQRLGSTASLVVLGCR
jgi:hypothetical protein